MYLSRLPLFTHTKQSSFHGYIVLRWTRAFDQPPPAGHSGSFLFLLNSVTDMVVGWVDVSAWRRYLSVGLQIHGCRRCAVLQSMRTCGAHSKENHPQVMPGRGCALGRVVQLRLQLAVIFVGLHSPDVPSPLPGRPFPDDLGDPS